MSTRSNGRVTRAHLLEVASKLLSENGPANVGLEVILQRSGVSTGSLYHHFGNLENLVWAAQAKLMADELAVDNNFFRENLLRCGSGIEVKRLLHATVVGMFEDAAIRRRARRLTIIEGSAHNDVAREYLREIHEAGNEFLSETFKLANEKDFLDLKATADDIARISQVLLFSASFLDVVGESITVRNLWIDLTVDGVSQLLGVVN